MEFFAIVLTGQLPGHIWPDFLVEHASETMADVIKVDSVIVAGQETENTDIEVISDKESNETHK